MSIEFQYMQDSNYFGILKYILVERIAPKKDKQTFRDGKTYVRLFVNISLCKNLLNTILILYAD